MRTTFIALAVVATLSGTWLYFGITRPIESARPGTATLRPLGRVEIKETEAGQVAVGNVTLINDGDADLHIAGVRSSCSCTGLETKNADGTLTRLSSLSIPPGGQVPVVIRLAVNGPIGGPIDSVVYFLTNDPEKPEVTLPIHMSRVLHGAQAVPGVVAFGTVPVGQPVTQIVDIIDRSLDPRSGQILEVHDPNVLSAELIPVPEAEASALGGRVIARVKVVVDTKAAGPVEGRVNLWLVPEKTASPVSVRVTGRVAAPVEMSPSTLTLPLQSDAGPVYRGIVVCRSHGVAAKLRVVNCPPGFVVRLPEPTPSGTPQLIQVEQTDKDSPAGPVTIMIGVTLNGVEKTYPIKVIRNL
jgi:hypothetical protein